MINFDNALRGMLVELGHILQDAFGLLGMMEVTELRAEPLGTYGRMGWMMVVRPTVTEPMGIKMTKVHYGDTDYRWRAVLKWEAYR